MVRKKHLLNQIQMLQHEVAKLEEELSEMTEKVNFVFSICNPGENMKANSLFDEWINGVKEGSEV